MPPIVSGPALDHTDRSVVRDARRRPARAVAEARVLLMTPPSSLLRAPVGIGSSLLLIVLAAFGAVVGMTGDEWTVPAAVAASTLATAVVVGTGVVLVRIPLRRRAARALLSGCDRAREDRAAARVRPVVVHPSHPTGSRGGIPA
jgi:hypothetical protein